MTASFHSTSENPIHLSHSHCELKLSAQRVRTKTKRNRKKDEFISTTDEKGPRRKGETKTPLKTKQMKGKKREKITTYFVKWKNINDPQNLALLKRLILISFSVH